MIRIPERFFKQNNEIIINLICKYAKTLNPIIIDVACGTASKGSYVKCRLGKIGMRPFTIGIDPQAFPEQKTRLNYVINKNIENIQDILPVADFVVCQGLPLAESGYKIKTFKAVMKFLKPGGKFIFQVAGKTAVFTRKTIGKEYARILGNIRKNEIESMRQYQYNASIYPEYTYL